MPTREQVAKMLSRGPSPRSGSAPAPAPAAAAPSPTTLPPAPDGYAYAWNETHRQFLLVQVSVPRAAAPQPSRLVGPGGQPLGSPGGPRGAMTTQLLRPGVDSMGRQVTPYQDLLANARDMDLDPNGDPNSNPSTRLFLTLVPDPEQAAREFPSPRALKPEYDSDREDPFGGRTVALRIGSIADGSAAVPPGPSTDPSAQPAVVSGE